MFNEPVRFRQYKGIRTYATYHYNGSSRAVFKSPYGAHLHLQNTKPSRNSLLQTHLGGPVIRSWDVRDRPAVCVHLMDRGNAYIEYKRDKQSMSRTRFTIELMSRKRFSFYSQNCSKCNDGKTRNYYCTSCKYA